MVYFIITYIYRNAKNANKLCSPCFLYFLCLGKFGTADHKIRQFDRSLPFWQIWVGLYKIWALQLYLGGQNGMPIKLYHPRCFWPACRFRKKFVFRKHRNWIWHHFFSSGDFWKTTEIAQSLEMNVWSFTK